MSPKCPYFIFLIFCKRTGFSKSTKSVLLHFSAFYDFSKLLFFVLKFSFRSELARYIQILFFFLRPSFFRHYTTFLQFFIDAPSTFTERKRFARIEDSLGFSALCDIFRKKIRIFLSPVGKKRFPSLIEHERNPLGVSKLFSELFIKTS